MPAPTSGGVSSSPATSGRRACRDRSRPHRGRPPARSPSPGRVPNAYPTTLVTNVTPDGSGGNSSLERQQPAARLRGPAVPEPQLPSAESQQFQPAARRRRADRPECQSEHRLPAGHVAHLRCQRQRQGQLRRPERGRRDEPVRAQRAARFALRLWRSRVALPPAGRRRRLAGLPAGAARPDQLHQPGGRPAPAPALRAR